jgi:hypothetical protein
MKLWLDDERPAPEGWTWVKTLEEAKQQLVTGQVEEASLDHDLGLRKIGSKKVKLSDGSIIEEDVTIEENGTHLVDWMAATNHWPKQKPRVHSMNPVGAQRMRQTIERYFPTPSSH